MSGNLWMFSDKLDDEDIEIMKHEFITYYQGADYYGLGLKMFTRLAHEAGAVYKIGKKVLIRRTIFDEYLRQQYHIAQMASLAADGKEASTRQGTVSENAAYSGKKPSGKISVAGSSSVSPVMEKLAEAYQKVNTNAKVEIQTSDSSAGMQSAMGGTCDIGMASRDLKDEEKSALKVETIAKDGIAVIVNNANTCDDLTLDQVKSIYTGETTVWSDIIK